MPPNLTPGVNDNSGSSTDEETIDNSLNPSDNLSDDELEEIGEETTSPGDVSDGSNGGSGSSSEKIDNSLNPSENLSQDEAEEVAEDTVTPGDIDSSGSDDNASNASSGAVNYVREASTPGQDTTDTPQEFVEGEEKEKISVADDERELPRSTERINQLQSMRGTLQKNLNPGASQYLQAAEKTIREKRRVQSLSDDTQFKLNGQTLTKEEYIQRLSERQENLESGFDNYQARRQVVRKANEALNRDVEEQARKADLSDATYRIAGRKVSGAPAQAAAYFDAFTTGGSSGELAAGAAFSVLDPLAESFFGEGPDNYYKKPGQVAKENYIRQRRQQETGRNTLNNEAVESFTSIPGQVVTGSAVAKGAQAASGTVGRASTRAQSYLNTAFRGGGAAFTTREGAEGVKNIREGDAGEGVGQLTELGGLVYGASRGATDFFSNTNRNVEFESTVNTRSRTGDEVIGEGSIQGTVRGDRGVLRSPVTRQGLRSPVSRRQTSKELSGNFVTRSDVETGSGQSTGRIRVGGEDRDFETVSTVADRTGDVSTVDSVSRSRTEGTFFRGRQSSESTENVIRQDQYDARVKEAVQDAYKETDATVTELSSLGRGSDGLTVKGDTTVIDRTGSTGTGNSGSGGSAFSSSGAGGGGRQVFSSSGSREGAETGGSSGVDPENLNPSSQTVEDVVSDVEGGSGGEGASAGFAASLGSGQTRETGGGEVSFTGKGPVSFDYSSATVQETGSTKRKTIQETGGGQSTSQRTSSRSGKSSGGTGGQVTQVDTGSSTSRTGFNVSTNTGTGQRENNRAVPGVSTSVGQSNRAGNRQRNNVNLGIGTGLAVSNRAANVQSQNARTTNKQRFGTAFTSSPGRSGGRGSAGFGFGASNFDFEAFETGNERSSGSESSSSVAPGLISYTLAEAQGEETSIDYSEGDSLVFGAPTEAESEGSLDTEFYSGVGGDLFK